MSARACSICEAPADMACADCVIDTGIGAAVCARTECRDAHEAEFHPRTAADPTAPAGTIDEGIAAVLAGTSRSALVLGDCRDILRTLPNASVEAMVTDPPAGIGFMGKTWDKPGQLGVSGGMACEAARM